jgi:glutaminase
MFDIWASKRSIGVSTLAVAALFSACASAPQVSNQEQEQEQESQAVTSSEATSQTNLPSASVINSAIQDAYNKYKTLEEGKNADYIPALAKVPSKLYGIALVTVDGKTYTTGDVDYQFSIQSISKVFTMANVIQDQGEKQIENSVGVDATGQAFNSIVAIEQYKGKEMNPLVNAGAIATTSMVRGMTPDEKWNQIIGTYSDFAGRPLEVNQEVYKSESDTNQRNQAIAMLMKAYEILKDDPETATDLYTRQCSVNVNAKDLATMAATLANGGLNPVTGKKVIDQKHVKSILAVMTTAGLYDDSGKWLFQTGLPGKSGVGGGIIAVAPGKFGIAVFSPPLDKAGNSVRAQKAITDIVASLDANPYDVAPVVPTETASVQ